MENSIVKKPIKLKTGSLAEFGRSAVRAHPTVGPVLNVVRDVRRFLSGNKEKTATGATGLTSVGTELESGLSYNPSGLATLREQNKEQPLGSSVTGTDLNPNRTQIKVPENLAFYQNADKENAAKRATSVGGTPTSGEATVATLTAEQQKEADGRRYLQDESASSLAMGSKSYVDALRGDKTDDFQTADIEKEDTPVVDTPVNNPTITEPGPVQPSALDALRGKVTGLSSLSADEQRLQDELTSYQEAARLGISGLEGQGRGIPLDLIRGQQGQLAEQAGIREQTMLDRLAAASAQRQNQLLAAQTELDYATSDQSRQDSLAAANRVTVGGNILERDPATGEYKTVYSAPTETTPVEQPATVQEYEYAKTNGYTGSFLDYQAAKAAASGSGSSGSSGAFTLGDTRYNADGSVLADGSQSTSSAGLSDLGSQALSLVGELISDPGRAGATGTARVWAAIPGTPAYDYRAKLERLQSLLSLDSIKYLKGTGAISDKESAILQSASAALKPGMSEDAFLKELQRIQTDLSAASQGTTQGGATSQDTPQARQSLRDSGWSEDKINEYFTNDPSTSVNGSKATGTQAANVLASTYKPGTRLGQCGRVVNRLTGFKMGNSYESKMAYTDPEIGRSTPVQPGDVFVMPWKQYGHTGFVADGQWIKKADGSYDIPVIDSNWNSDEKVSHHYINSSKMSGFARAPINTGRVSFS